MTIKHRIAGDLRFTPDNFGGGHLTDDNGAYVGNVQWEGNGPEIARRWNTYPDMLDALRPFAGMAIGEDFTCHVGLVSMEDCSRCGSILRARAAIAKAMGEEVKAGGECEACGRVVADFSDACPAISDRYGVNAHVRRLSDAETVRVDA